MKRILWLVLVVLLAVTGGLPVGAEGIGGEAYDYFPLIPMNIWLYKVSLTEEKVFSQLVVVNGQTGQDIKTTVFFNKTPVMEVTYIYNEDGLFRTKQISAEGVETLNPKQMVLASKLAVGTGWDWKAADGQAKETTKVIGFEEVIVPAGTFQTLLVQYEGVDKSGAEFREKAWFAKGVGYVKAVTVIGGETITKELVGYGELTPVDEVDKN
ncbi:MAG: hypothetical protein GX075_12140 [Firmicutes bacterium]|nr:hypothetical protein [Bacillota bacterium]